jgi:2-polyprenyl-3-methyl-5-hydroxy-6-metoxy-1,4-benzoquinol methylase
MAPTYNNFIFNADRGFIFAYVPKVACTNWKSLLRYMAGYDNWLDNKLAHDKVNGGLRYLDLNGPEAALLEDASIRKFTMVRAPYSRILSAYLNKVERLLPVQPETEGEDYFHNVLRDIDAFRRNVLGATAFPEITFEVFLRWLRDSGSWFAQDEHWTPQVALLRQPRVSFDIIGKFENLKEDAPRILDAMGCDQRFPSQKEVNFAPTGAVDKLARYYTPACYKLVDDIYAEDFIQFGFEKKTAKVTAAPVPTQAPARHPLDTRESKHSEILAKSWYYIAELEKGLFTPGKAFKNISVTRNVLDAINVKDASVIDMSTMEGMFSILLSRRGANVMATDTINNSDKINYLKKIYGVDFDYYPHSPVTGFVDYITNMQASLDFAPNRAIEFGDHTPYGFDVVLSSGVIYHVHNPIEHIVNFRRLCKTGGLVVMESAALLSDEIEMVHDWQGDKQTYGGNATWYPSTRALEIFMRAAYLEPLGFSYIKSGGLTDLNLCRITIVARAVPERVFAPEDVEIIRGSELYKNYDFKPIFPSARLTGKSALPLEVDTSKLLPADNLRASTIARHPPLSYPDAYLTLRLDDQ